MPFRETQTLKSVQIMIRCQRQIEGAIKSNLEGPSAENARLIANLDFKTAKTPQFAAGSQMTLERGFGTKDRGRLEQPSLTTRNWGHADVDGPFRMPRQVDAALDAGRPHADVAVGK